MNISRPKSRSNATISLIVIHFYGGYVSGTFNGPLAESRLKLWGSVELERDPQMSH